MSSSSSASFNLPSLFGTFHILLPISGDMETSWAGREKRNQHSIILTFDLSLEQKVQFLNATVLANKMFPEANMLSSLD